MLLKNESFYRSPLSRRSVGKVGKDVGKEISSVGKLERDMSAK